MDDSINNFMVDNRIRFLENRDNSRWCDPDVSCLLFTEFLIFFYCYRFIYTLCAFDVFSPVIDLCLFRMAATWSVLTWILSTVIPIHTQMKLPSCIVTPSSMSFTSMLGLVQTCYPF